MTNVPAQRTRSLFPDLAEIFSGFPSWGNMRPLLDTNLMRLEEELGDGKYEVRAEIPGVDPAKDIDISVNDGRLTIKAERTEKTEQTGRSEFSYGSFTRSITLPKGADEDAVKASYDQGILTVTVPMSDKEPQAKRIEIETKSS
ncbi:Hsp20/alpha crystallin family protein [Mycolicibacterium baixiangningiae]|uniref:Hsp20/alpha crystallin family protein n=1 Tax=Mycolicibacterium baixiangningiae TaxID=2761578 RepID=UPI001867FB84|nr:Hsp20/alpha crystallin family protein [Mycolicibacterium baixiangningiae]